MKPKSLIRRTRPRSVAAPLSRGFVQRLLCEFPGADPIGVTVRLADEAMVGIAIGSALAGVQVLDPDTGDPVRWVDVGGVPHWSRDRGPSTGAYVSAIVSRATLVQTGGFSNGDEEAAVRA